MSAVELSVKLPENCYQMLEEMAQENNTSITMELIDVISQAYLLHHKGAYRHLSPLSSTEEDTALFEIIKERRSASFDHDQELLRAELSAFKTHSA